MCFGSKKKVADSRSPVRVQPPNINTPTPDPANDNPWSAANIRKAYSHETIRDQWSKDTIREQWKVRPGDGGKEKHGYLASSIDAAGAAIAGGIS